MSRNDPNLGPVRSALTLRLWLAGFGLLFCGVATAIVAATGPLWLAVLFLVLAVVAVGDLRVVARRKRRGEPG